MTNIIPPPVRTPEQAVAVLLTLWICFIIFNVFLSNTGLITQTNLIFIVLIVVTIVAYFLGKKYWKKRK